MKTSREICLVFLVLTSVSCGSIPAASIGAPHQDGAVLPEDESFVAARAASNNSAQVTGIAFAGDVLPSGAGRAEDESRTEIADLSALTRLQQWLHDRGCYPGAIDGQFGSESWRSLQQYLKVKGIYEGDLDGQPGAATREALKKLQRSFGLEETGKLDAATVQKLTFKEPQANAPHVAHWVPMLVLALCCVFAWTVTWLQIHRTRPAGTSIWRSPSAYAAGCTALAMAWIGFAGFEPFVRDAHPVLVIVYLIGCVAALTLLPIRIIRWGSCFLNLKSLILAYAVIQTSGLLVSTAILPFVSGPDDMPVTVNAQAFLDAAALSFTGVLLMTAVPTLLYAWIMAGFASWLRAHRRTPWCLYPFAIVLTTLIVFAVFGIPAGGRSADVFVFSMELLIGPSLLGAGALHILDLKLKPVR